MGKKRLEEEMPKMKKTGILCIECMKGKLVSYGKELYCENCGTDFEFTDKESKTYRYK